MVKSRLVKRIAADAKKKYTVQMDVTFSTDVEVEAESEEEAEQLAQEKDFSTVSDLGHFAVFVNKEVVNVSEEYE